MRSRYNAILRELAALELYPNLTQVGYPGGDHALFGDHGITVRPDGTVAFWQRIDWENTDDWQDAELVDEVITAYENPTKTR
jgi:hypothetical protein